jgi:hypothetical protein
MLSSSITDPPDALPASYIVPSTTEVSNGVSARLNVGQDLRDPTADLDDGADYFQACGRRDRLELEGVLA